MKKTSTIPKALFQSPPSQGSAPDNLIHKRKQRYLSLGLLLIFTIFSHMGMGMEHSLGYETTDTKYEDAPCGNLRFVTTDGISNAINVHITGPDDNDSSYTIFWKKKENTGGWQSVTINNGLFYRIDNLESKTNYDIEVQLFCNGTFAEKKITRASTDSQPSIAPCVLSGFFFGASQVTTQTIKINWTAPGGKPSPNASYKVFWRIKDSDADWSESSFRSGLSYTISGLIFNTKYEIKVEMYCSGVRQGSIKPLFGYIRTAAGGAAHNLCSPNPTDLNFSILSNSSGQQIAVRYSFTAHTQSANHSEKYYVEVAVDNGSFRDAFACAEFYYPSSDGGGSRQFSCTDYYSSVYPGQKIRWRIRIECSRFTGSHVGYSRETIEFIVPNPPPPPPPPVPCNSPVNLTSNLVDVKGNERITEVHWERGRGQNIQGYSVVEKTVIPPKGSSDLPSISFINTDARRFLPINHMAFRKMRIRIKNVCKGKDTEWSKPIVIGTAAPTIKGIVKTAGGYVPIWIRETPGARGYRIIVKTQGSSFAGQIVRDVPASEDRIFIPFSLMPKGPWTFWILAKYSPNRGWSGWSRRNFGVNGTGPLANGMESAGSSSLSANNASLAGNKTAIIYPNTNRGNFKIQFKDKYELVKSVTIFNMFGIQVFNKKYDSNLEEEEYNLGDQLNSGMYKVVIKTENGVEYKTLLVEQ